LTFSSSLRLCASAVNISFFAPALPSSQMDSEQFHRVSRALADPRRMEILERIANADEMACASLANESDVSQPTISHHLKELSVAGLIKPRREAKFCYYRLDRKVWAEYLAEMRRRVPARRPKA
jgi:ArsR family transcriptional regulator, arsenate/arsenite/antimonite-responsive transcriptional repressor